jgi:hypothetical protein
MPSPFVFDDIDDDQATRAISFDTLYTSDTQAAKTAFKEALLGVASYTGIKKANEVRFEEDTAKGLTYGLKSPTLSIEELNTRYSLDGRIKFDKPMTARAAKIIYDSYLEQEQRNSVIYRNKGAVGEVAQFAAGTIGSIVDPLGFSLNLLTFGGAAAEIQVGKMLSGSLIKNQAAKTFLGRAAGGAVEGILGNAALEPFSYMTAGTLKQDYGLSNTISNLAFGAIGGAGFGAIGGAAGDFYRRSIENKTAYKFTLFENKVNEVMTLNKKTHEAAIKSAMTQTLMGNEVDVRKVVEVSEKIEKINNNVEVLEEIINAEKSTIEEKVEAGLIDIEKLEKLKENDLISEQQYNETIDILQNNLDDKPIEATPENFIELAIKNGELSREQFEIMYKNGDIDDAQYKSNKDLFEQKPVDDISSSKPIDSLKEETPVESLVSAKLKANPTYLELENQISIQKQKTKDLIDEATKISGIPFTSKKQLYDSFSFYNKKLNALSFQFNTFFRDTEEKLNTQLKTFFLEEQEFAGIMSRVMTNIVKNIFLFNDISVIKDVNKVFSEKNTATSFIENFIRLETLYIDKLKNAERVFGKEREENFKKWFGKSKIKEGNKPKVVFHGGNDFFVSVNKETFFASNPIISATYSLNSITGGNIMPVYLKMENPLVIEAQGYRWSSIMLTKKIYNNLKKIGLPIDDLLKDNKTFKKNMLFYLDKQTTSLEKFSKKEMYLVKEKVETLDKLEQKQEKTYFYTFGTEDLIRYIKQYAPDIDGIVYKNLEDIGPAGVKSNEQFGIEYNPYEAVPKELLSDVYVTLKENQVKSALGNLGTFDAENIDIRRQDTRAILEKSQTAQYLYTIKLMADADISSPLHEIAHVYFEYMHPEEKEEVIKWAKKQKKALKSELEDVEAYEEIFAYGFEKFLATNEGKKTIDNQFSTVVKDNIFQKFIKKLQDIFSIVTDLIAYDKIKLNKTIEQIYIKMVDFESNIENLKNLVYDLDDLTAELAKTELGIDRKQKALEKLEKNTITEIMQELEAEKQKVELEQNEINSLADVLEEQYKTDSLVDEEAVSYSEQASTEIDVLKTTSEELSDVDFVEKWVIETLDENKKAEYKEMKKELDADIKEAEAFSNAIREAGSCIIRKSV